jgi:hypothetical protein
MIAIITIITIITIIIRFFVLLLTKKIIRTILNVIHKNQKQLLLDIQDITSINGGAISILAHCVKIGSPIDVRQINMLHKRDRIVRRKTSGRRMNTLALEEPGTISAPEDAREWQVHRHRYRGCGGLLHGHEARQLPGDRRMQAEDTILCPA